MSIKYYKSSWEIKNKDIVYGSWKDGSDIYKNNKGYFIVQYDPRKMMYFTKTIKFKANPMRKVTRKFESKKYKKLTRKTK